MTENTLIIPAAGSGSRMNLDVPKPFLEIGGVTILAHTIRAFTNIGSVSRLIVPTTRSNIEVVKSIIQSEGIDIEYDVIEGGDERQYSIKNALDLIKHDFGLVTIHDAVRPFVKPAQIMDCISKADEKGAAIVAVPVKDTIKKLSPDYVIESTPDRSKLWQAQTPQIFRTSLIREAYQIAIDTGFLGTDDASLVENIGHEVFVVEGDRLNFKITYPLDLQLATLLLEE